MAELNELKKISKILILANGEALERELSKHATTNERKKVWALINGQRLPEQLAKDSDMKVSGLYSYLKLLASAELIQTPYGKPPMKVIDYVPASWLELLEQGEKKAKEE